MSNREKFNNYFHKCAWNVKEISEITGYSVASVYSWKYGHRVPHKSVYKLLTLWEEVSKRAKSIEENHQLIGPPPYTVTLGVPSPAKTHWR
jgi:hypothetical protein